MLLYTLSNDYWDNSDLKMGWVTYLQYLTVLRSPRSPSASAPLRDLLDAPTALAACCGFDLYLCICIFIPRTGLAQTNAQERYKSPPNNRSIKPPPALT
jgi:hypothetical protein